MSTVLSLTQASLIEQPPLMFEGLRGAAHSDSVPIFHRAHGRHGRTAEGRAPPPPRPWGGAGSPTGLLAGLQTHTPEPRATGGLGFTETQTATCGFLDRPQLTSELLLRAAAPSTDVTSMQLCASGALIRTPSVDTGTTTYPGLSLRGMDPHAEARARGEGRPSQDGGPSQASVGPQPPALPCVRPVGATSPFLCIPPFLKAQSQTALRFCHPHVNCFLTTRWEVLAEKTCPPPSVCLA